MNSLKANRHRLVEMGLGITILSSQTWAQTPTQVTTPCGPLYAAGQYGPYDYRSDKKMLPIVLNSHFPIHVEQLIRGNRGTLGGDIDYTLRAIPNHPNALLAMMKLGERENAAKPSGSSYTIECWFERAIRFQPDDLVVRMLYANFLIRQKRGADALRALEVVLQNSKDNPITHYNLGLLYFDLGEFEKALGQAHISAELGLTWQELPDKLKAGGHWKPSQNAEEPNNIGNKLK